MNPKSHMVIRYGISLAAVLLAFFGFRVLGWLVAGELPTFLTFYPAVVVVALLAGIGPGLAATAMAALIADFFCLAPSGSFGFGSPRDAVSLAIFTGMGVFMSMVAEMQRRTRHPEALEVAGEQTRQGRSDRLLIGAGLLASLAVLVTVFSLMRLSLKADHDADSLVFHTQTVVCDLDLLLSELKDAETGERGYLITGKTEYLEPYHEAEQQVVTLLGSLFQLTRSNHSQQVRLTRLAALTKEKLARLGKNIDLSRTRGFGAAHAAVANGEGRALMEKIRRGVGEAEAEEQRLLRERTAVMVSRRKGTENAVMGGGLLSLMLLGTVFLFLIQENRLRRNAQAVLYQSEQRYRDILAHQAVFVDRYLPGGVLTFVNDALARFTGLAPEQLLGKSFYDFIAEDQRAEVVRTIESLCAEHPTAVVENQVVFAGGVRWHQWKHRALFDRDGNIVEYQASGRDVTEKRLAETALRESEERYRAVVESQSEVVARYLPDGTCTFVNEAFSQFFGRRPGALVGASWLSDVVSEDIPMVEGCLKLLTPAHPVADLECRMITGCGDIRWMQFVNHGFFDPQGQLAEIQAVGRDTTERRQLHETLEKYARRLIVLEEDLRNRIAMELHDDIGQLLTALGLDLAHIRHHLPEGSGERLRSTLEDSRLLTKEISQKVRNLMVDLCPPQLDEYGLAAAITSYAEQYARRTGIDIAVQADPRLPRLPVREELGLFRITQEALNNVAKHAGATQVSISLHCDGAAIIRLAISDNGTGFVPRNASPQASGSGWGLTIMRERAELAGGSFRLDTVPGKGTAVVVEIMEETAIGEGKSRT